MMQVVKRWKVVVTFKTTTAYTLIIHDNIYNNMLRKLNDISFESEPIRIEIDLIIEPKQEGIFNNA